LRVPKQKKFSLKPGTLSPNKVGKDYLEPIEGTTKAPEFDKGSDYYKEFWRLFL